MKKIFYIIFILFAIIISCNNESSKVDEIKNQISKYKQQITELNSKIKVLESQINTDSLKIDFLKVDTMIIKEEVYYHYISITSNVEAEKYAFISPQMNGQIVKIYVHEGQRVKTGQLLAKLNDDVLQKNLAQLRTNLFLADTMYQKQKILFEQKIVSEVQYLQAKNQKEALEKNIEIIKSQISQSQIRAPFSGIIDKIEVKEGELASPGRAIFQLVNLNTMFSTAEVSEKYLPVFNIGDKVLVNFPTYKDIKIETKIYQKGNIIDAKNRTFWLKIKYPNVKEKIKPNMLSVVEICDYKGEDDIVVPSEILNQDANGWYVFGLEKNKKDKYIANKKYVEIGISDDKRTVISKGLEPSDIVITSGHNQVAEAMEVQIVSAMK